MGLAMNWDAIGAIGEIVGAIAVVFSLLYLAVQLRHSTKFARTEYHTKTVNMMAPSAHWRAASSDNARIFREGMRNFRALHLDERLMLDGVLGIMVVSFKDVLEAYKNNFLEKETYQAWEGYVGGFLSMPGGAMWWEQAKIRYTDEVQQTVDSAIEKAMPYDQRMPILFEAEAMQTDDSGN